jgi:aminotransferase
VGQTIVLWSVNFVVSQPAARPHSLASRPPRRPTSRCGDPDELRAAFTGRTKAVILNLPNNPTGKVLSRDELLYIAGLCQEFDCLAITDEIFEHILYDGSVHVPIVSLSGMRERPDP